MSFCLQNTFSNLLCQLVQVDQADDIATGWHQLTLHWTPLPIWPMEAMEANEEDKKARGRVSPTGVPRQTNFALKGMDDRKGELGHNARSGQ